MTSIAVEMMVTLMQLTAFFTIDEKERALRQNEINKAKSDLRGAFTPKIPYVDF